MVGILLPLVFVGALNSYGPSAPPCDATLPSQLDIIDCRLAAAVERSLERSATLREVVRRVGALQGRVYIRTVVSVMPGGPRSLLGGLSHDVVTCGPYRLLHVTVRHGYDDKAVATIGHELQHAVEVLEHPEAGTQFEVDGLFLRIGEQVAARVVETRRALAVEAMVFRELRRAKRQPGRT